MSLEITIDGAKFTMQDDVAFPYLPRVSVLSSGYTNIFDFDAGDGSATSPNKWMWMYLNNGSGSRVSRHVESRSTGSAEQRRDIRYPSDRSAADAAGA